MKKIHAFDSPTLGTLERAVGAPRGLGSAAALTEGLGRLAND